ncbi:MAG: ATP-binding protein, partial [Clostridium sp.]
MNESILERIQSSAKALKIDLYTAELASYADEKELTPEALEAVCGVFEYLEQKKYDSMVHTMLKLSKLPMNEPKTFERFDFSRLHGKHVQSLKNLSSLSALYAGKNLAFIGPQGV